MELKWTMQTFVILDFFLNSSISPGYRENQSTDLPSDINQFNHEGESFLECLSVTKGMEGTCKCKAKN